MYYFMRIMLNHIFTKKIYLKCCFIPRQKSLSFLGKRAAANFFLLINTGTQFRAHLFEHKSWEKTQGKVGGRNSQRWDVLVNEDHFSDRARHVQRPTLRDRWVLSKSFNFNWSFDYFAVVLRRKEVGNPEDYFDKSFEEYEYGFESKGNLKVI